jgi:phage baseplate assembly protein W
VDEGDPATFGVTALNATGYQWQRKEPLGTTWADVTGATSASYTTPVFGTTSHQAQYRVVVSNAAGSVTSVGVYFLVTGYPLPGSTGAISPNRPTVTGVELTDVTLGMTVAGTADVFRVELQEDNVVVAYAETVSAGSLSVVLPERGHEYIAVVVAGNYGSTHWSLPGFVGTYTARSATPEPQDPQELVEVEFMFSDLDPYLSVDYQGNMVVLKDQDAIDASIENILGIEPGELVMNPTFGSSMAAMIGRDVNDSTAAFIRMAISESLAQDPRVVVDNVGVKANPDDGEYDVTVEYRNNVTYLRGLFERTVKG